MAKARAKKRKKRAPSPAEALAEPVDARRPFLLATAVVCIAAGVTWSHAVPSGLLASWDDERFILENDDVQNPSVDAFVSFFTESHMEAWHPLHMLSYWLDVPWAGTDGPVIHAVSLLLWLCALVAVLAVMVRLGLPLPIAVVATLAYGLHPTQVEAVTWATGRKDILACLFSCLAILAHLRSEAIFDRASWLARAFYVLGAMSKTTVLPLVGVLFLIDVLHRGVPWRKALLRQVPTVLVGLALSVVVVLIWQDNEMIRPDAAGDELGGRVMLVLASVTHHLRMAVLPIDNSPLYPIHREADLPLTSLVGPVILVAALVWAWRRGDRRAVLALAGFLVLLLPVVNVIPMYWHWMDRYLSLPLLMLAFGFGHLVERIASIEPSRRRAVVVGAGVLVALLAGRTWSHQMAYAEDLTLWRHATRAQPESYHAWIKLGEVLRDRGEWEESITAYERAIELEPTLVLAPTALFVVHARRDEANHELTPAQSLALGVRYQRGVDDVETLRTLAGDMVQMGYRESVFLPLDRSLLLSPIDDGSLLRAAQVQRGHGNDWLAEYYESRMRTPPRPTDEPGE